MVIYGQTSKVQTQIRFIIMNLYLQKEGKTSEVENLLAVYKLVIELCSGKGKAWKRDDEQIAKLN